MIRPAMERDVEAITGIYGYHVLHGTASFEIAPPDFAEMMRRYLALHDQGYPYLVAAADGAVVAYAYAGPYRPRIAYQHTVEDSIYIRPDRIGRGIGSRLLAALIQACEQRGYRQMVAVIGDSASIASIALHKRQGFSQVGTLRSVGHKHGRWLDSVLLQRGLSGGDTVPPSLTP